MFSQLKIIQDFQQKYPTAHVGGSIGLFLHGIDLKRHLSNSDIDITIDCLELSQIDKDYESRSDSNDFDFSVKKVHDTGHYTKIDIRVNPEPMFGVINYNGFDYKVSRLKDILFWKEKYAKKGVIKHIHDLEVIKTGIRPPLISILTDDLPF